MDFGPLLDSVNEAKRKRPFKSYSLKDLIKFAGGEEAIKAKNKTNTEAYAFLRGKEEEFALKILQDYEETEELNPNAITDWVDSRWDLTPEEEKAMGM